MPLLNLDIVARVNGLQNTLEDAGSILDGFCSGSVMDASKALTSLLGKLGPVGIAAGAALAALTALTYGAGKMAAEYAKLSKEFGVNAEAIQKIEKTYSSTGMEAEKLLDINKDAAEKLGEAWREGTGEFKAALDMIKGDIKDYAAFVNDPEGGRKTAELWYYQAKAAGLAHAEIIAGMERIASDSSKMVGTLSESNDYWEHQIKLQQKSAYVSEGTAHAYSDAGSKLAELGKNILGVFAEVFSFIPKGFNTVYDYFNKDIKNTTFYLSIQAVSKFISEKLPPLFEKAKNALTAAIQPMINMFTSVYDTIVKLYNKMAEIVAKVQNAVKGASKSALDFFGVDTSFLDFEIPALTTDNIKEGAKILGRTIESAIVEGVSGGTASTLDQLAERQRQANEEELKAKAAELKAQQEKQGQNNSKALCPICKNGAHAAADCPETKKTQDAAKKAAEAAKKLREQAYKDLEAINVSLYSSVEASVASSNKQITDNLAKLKNALEQGIITQEQYEEKRSKLIDANADNFRKSVLGANPADALMMLDASRKVYDQSVADLETMFNNKLIKESEYLQRKKDLEAAFGARTDATKGLDGVKSDELANSFGDRYLSLNEQKYQDIANAKKDYDVAKENINKLPEAERFKQLQALNEAHNKKMREIDLKYNNMRLTDTQNMFGGFGDAMAAFGLESTAIGKGIFAAQKGLSIAQAMINAHESATKAMATYPGPLGVAMGAASYASAIARVGQMKSIDGMAHDGIDNIPREGTWLLQKGERVVDDRTNGDLKEFLSNQNSSNSNNMQPIQVSAPLNIQGSVHSSDKAVMEAIKRHPQMVAQAVQDAQRRRM